MERQDLQRGLGHLERACPVRTALDVIGGRWKPTILLAVKDGGRRYGEIAAEIPSISPQALTLQLKQLVADDVLVHDAAAQLYALTPRGERLSSVMDGLADWGSDYLDWREAEA